MNIFKSIFKNLFGYNKEKTFNTVANGVFNIIDALVHIECHYETDRDKKIIADFVQDNTTPVILAIKKGCPDLAKLCMEYANVNWDIEKFRAIAIIEKQKYILKNLNK